MIESIKPFLPFTIVYFEVFEMSMKPLPGKNILNQQLEGDF
jgi:hypothetical protein